LRHYYIKDIKKTK